MKSIRRRLTGWFLASLGVLWLAAGASVYFSYRAGLVAGMEAELQTMCRQVRSAASMGGGGPGRGGPWVTLDLKAMQALGPDVLWQVWRPAGDEIDRSENLSSDLPRADEGRAKIITLKDGTRVMCVGHRYGGGGGGGHGQGQGRWGPGGGPGGGMEVSVARPLDALEGKLMRLLAILAGSGVVLGGLAWAWVRFVVRDGLSPLRRIADEIGRIDGASLGGRFRNDGMPAELEPIVHRLNQLMARLESSFSRERRFSADLAHEMRTPLAEAKAIAETAITWPAEGGPEAWREVVASVERMESVVHSMLQLARLESETPGTADEPFPLAPLVAELWLDHAAPAEARGIHLRSEIAQDAEVSGDRSWWGHLLGNLLGNAAEYADEGSEVVVSLIDGGVSIKNRASGLVAEDVERLFERFWRADQARGESRHCGLGLSLASACADALGLRIEASLGGDHYLEMRVVRK
jgi:signal transduction histidine kinase